MNNSVLYYNYYGFNTHSKNNKGKVNSRFIGHMELDVKCVCVEHISQLSDLPDVLIGSLRDHI